MALVIVLMSLLGFTAYFSAIGMRIRIKAYQISILRAIGTPVKKIRRKLFADSLKIPAIACAISYIIVSRLQKLMSNKYAELLALNAPDENGVMHFDNDAVAEKSTQIINNYFLENQLWSVSITKPIIIIFVLMCAVTILLTLSALIKFKGNIADDLNKGRRKE